MKISIISICSLLLIICCKNIYAQDTLLYKVVSVDSIEMPELNYIFTLENNSNFYKVVSPKDTTVNENKGKVIHYGDFLFIQLIQTNKIKVQGNSYIYIYDDGLMYGGRVILEQGEYPYLSHQIVNNYYLPIK